MPTTVRGRASPRPSVLNCLFASLCFFFPLGVFAASPVVIGEVHWAGSSRSSADEWVELWNISSEEQSLAQWSLSGASSAPIVFNDQDHIPPHQVFLISNYAETNPKSALLAPPQLVTTDVSLSNETLHLVLQDPQGIVVDEVGDGSKPTAGSTNPTASMIRAQDDPPSWVTATSSIGFDLDASDLGTPGVCDGCIESFIADTEPTIDSTTETDSSSSTIPLADTQETTILIEDATNTSTTVTEAIVPAAPDPTIEETTSTPASSSTTVTADSQLPSSVCEWILFSLTPAPSSGPELVNVSGCDDPTSLFGWSMHDGHGSILTITSSTLVMAAESNSWQITMPGQHLNNTGDSVFLYGPDGRLSDQVSYPSMQHDEHYVRDEDGNWSIPERVPIIAQTPTIVVPATQAAITTTSIVDTTTTVSMTTTSTSKVPIKKIKAIPKTSTTSTTVKATNKKITSQSFDEYERAHASTTKPIAAKSKTTVKTKKAVKKSSAKPLTTDLPAQTSLESMSRSSSLAPHVQLHGVVGTPVNLIAKRRFVLLNADGTGLLVYGSTTQASPAFGSSIDIYGTLVSNDDGIHLEMRGKDRWQLSKIALPVPTSTSPDLMTLESTQAWSLVEITGQVQTRTSTTVHIDVDGTDVLIAIPRQLGYRAERLQKGDVIRVRGVLDMRAATLKIHPRTNEEITLVEHPVSHATLAITQTQHSSLPPWAPIGAAASTIAGGYGFMRWRSWYKQKQLERQLSVAIDHLTST